jgi:beta-glucosidase
VACDSYHRWEEDLDILQNLGIPNYRFSISWPRIFPTGRGIPNPAGLAYYDKLVDGCIARGIEPWITLYHWDLPQALQDEGGWLNRETVFAFASYVSEIARHFKGRVHCFYTLNEPQCIVGLGHRACSHAPGIPLSDADLFRSWHHLLLAHGLSCREIRRYIPDARIGIASTGALCYTASEHPDALSACRRASFTSVPPEANPAWFFNHQWFLDPICEGTYPEDEHSPWNELASDVPASDMEIIHQCPDFIGLNIYNGHEIEPNADGTWNPVPKYPGYPRTALKWPITPAVLYWGPKLIYDRYQIPIVISENGLSCNDHPYLDGKVHDGDRIDFLHRYLVELEKACDEGIPVLGYFHWSIIDNYEWNSGYEERFGLVYVDYRTQDRTLKDSACWYQQVIASNGANLK